MLERVWRRGKPSTLLGECKLVQPPWKTVRQFLKISKNRVFIRSNNSSPEHISGKKNYTLRRFMHPLFTAAKLTIAKTWGQPNCPSRDEWIKKMYMFIHTENGISPRRLKNEIMPFAAAWMDLEINILMEADRKRKTIFMWYHPYVESKRNMSVKQEETHKHTEQTCVCQGGMSGGLRWADEIYLYIEWIKNEVLQYGTGNSIQYLAINHNGKEYICWAESICCMAEMNYTSIIFLNF